ncbi:scamp family-domain-containing protein [Polychytrium aggregatum]|uniref:scamp family-domain-containing protein n=1 Tax=Polychytrium aggregatum TaxID=110093 RepID=UPI0022FF3C1B|nr:scamp family-domain-containing protein [Polychytrium aggregatum]KAI9204731.1 scamp family-domain-containing protein [Polychytrium aggregatum]
MDYDLEKNPFEAAHESGGSDYPPPARKAAQKENLSVGQSHSRVTSATSAASATSNGSEAFSDQPLNDPPPYGSAEPKATTWTIWGSSTNKIVPGNKSAQAEMTPEQRNLLSKEAELRRKEDELKAREARLAQTTAQLQAGISAVSRQPNFPPCWPMMYHNIQIDIPAGKARGIMIWLYRSWLSLFGVLVVNSIACFSILVSHPTGVTTGATDFGVSLMYLFTISIGSFFFWYKPVYRAYERSSSFSFYLYFAFNGLHIIYCFYMAVGMPGSGSGGLINMISMYTDDKIASGVLCSINSALWLASGLFSVYLYRLSHLFYRTAGLTADDARNEAVQRVAASGAVKQGVAAYMKSQTGSFA